MLVISMVKMITVDRYGCPKNVSKESKSKNFKTDAVPLKVLLAFIVIVIKQ